MSSTAGRIGGVEAGCDAFVAKPVDVELLFNTISELLALEIVNVGDRHDTAEQDIVVLEYEDQDELARIVGELYVAASQGDIGVCRARLEELERLVPHYSPLGRLKHWVGSFDLPALAEYCDELIADFD